MELFDLTMLMTTPFLPRAALGPWGSLVYPWWFGTTRLRFKSGRTHFHRMSRCRFPRRCPTLLMRSEGGGNRSLRDHFPPHRSWHVTIACPFEARRMMQLFLGHAREIEIRLLQKRAWLRSELARAGARRKVRGL